MGIFVREVAVATGPRCMPGIHQLHRGIHVANRPVLRHCGEPDPPTRASAMCGRRSEMEP
ncbi:hypothetical protein J6590_008804 [Homalodisca vitripennis]|nr:hypothetical protein J6590_008804 [Homalodisca vitripennis]